MGELMLADENISNIPAAMRARTQWLVWRYEESNTGKPTKVPYLLNGYDKAKSNDPSTWCNFDQVIQAEGFSGIGFAFAEGDGLVGIDLDECFSDSGELVDWAAEIVELFDGSYVEYSPSGAGLHLFCLGKPLRTGHRKLWVNAEGKKIGFEIYDYSSPRYLTVTGDVVRAVEPGNCQESLERLYETYWADEENDEYITDPNLKRLPVTDGSLEAALSMIPSDGYETWVKVGMALKYSGYPLDLWEQWSSSAANYKAGVCAKKWDTFKQDTGRHRTVGLGTIIYLARQYSGQPNLRLVQETPVTAGALERAEQPAGTPPAAADEHHLLAQPTAPAEGNPVEHPHWPGKTVPFAYRLCDIGLVKLSTEKPNGEKISGPILPIAETASPQGGNAGLVLEVISRDGDPFTLPIPRERLYEDAPLLARDLAHFNFSIVPGKEKELLKFLEACSSMDRRIAVTQTGWAASRQAERMVYVLPNSATDDGYHFQPERYSPAIATVRSSGTLTEWTDNVFDRAPYPLFAVLCALAAPLLKSCQSDSFGFHFHGSSSCGKTTLAQVAASVWGSGADPADAPEHSYIRRWHATGNSLEVYCASQNDMLVVFDEIGSHSSRDFGKAIYDITGGQGKGAMDQSRNLKKQRSWRNLFLSTGEISCRSKIEESITGKRGHAKAGQLLRLIDVAVNASIFNSRAQVDKLKRACSQFYGTLGPEYINRIVNKYDAGKFKDVMQNTYDAAAERLISGHVDFTAIQQRAAKRFALVETAGILLVHLDIIPGLTLQHIQQSVDTVFTNWLPSSTELNDIDRAITALREFILANRDARFKTLKANGETSETLHREIAGYYDHQLDISGGDIFYMLPQALREATGLEPHVIGKALRDRDYLKVEQKKHLTCRISADGKRIYTYGIKATLVEG